MRRVRDVESIGSGSVLVQAAGNARDPLPNQQAQI
jgi:hypothetical protein